MSNWFVEESLLNLQTGDQLDIGIFAHCEVDPDKPNSILIVTSDDTRHAFPIGAKVRVWLDDQREYACSVCGDPVTWEVEAHWQGWLDRHGDMLAYSPRLHDHTVDDVTPRQETEA